MKQYLEAGQIVGTHGIRGEVKLNPWSDGADFLADIPVFYWRDKPYAVESARVHKNVLLLKLAGISSVQQAEAMRGAVLLIDRADKPLCEDKCFQQDLIGLPVFDLRLGRNLGTLKEVLRLPASDVFAIRREGTEDLLIPARDPFLVEADPASGLIRVRTIPGMGDEEDGR